MLKSPLLRALAAGLSMSAWSVAAAPLILITKEEAALPSTTLTARSGVTLPPTIEVLSPKAGEPVKSPFRLRIAFRAHGDAKIDPGSVNLVYSRQPPVNLTERVKPFLTASRLDIQEVVVPPGQHEILISVSDDQLHDGVRKLALTVRP